MRLLNKIDLGMIRAKLLTEFGNDIKEVILFGSRAKGDATINSDYDILIILNKKDYSWKYKYQINEVIYDLELENDIIIDSHILSDYEVNNSLRGSQPIFINAIDNGIYL
jgi:predicted nucleotidyltransferase